MARNRERDRLGKKKVETAAQKGGKPLHDGAGLYFVPKPPAGWWKFKYRRPKAYGGTETSLSFGQYPAVDLEYAREQRDTALKELARGIDPGAKKKAEAESTANTFEAVAKLWLAAGCPGGKKSEGVAEGTVTQLTRRLENHVYPYIGTLPIRGVDVGQMRRVLDRLEKAGTPVLASRIRELCDRVFRWAVGKELTDTNPAAALKGTIATARVKHFPAIVEPRAFGALLRSIDGYRSGQPATRAAMQLLALLFTRPTELRHAKWGEFDLEAESPQWVVPEERTKMRKALVVPLPRQAVEILNALRPLTDRGADSWVFPSLRPQKPLSENAVNAALRTIGYDTEATHCGHGFRSSASSMLHSLGFAPDVIEMQLAHARPGVAGIYNRSHLLPQRRELMKAWGDYLDALKADTKATVTAIRA